MKELQLRPTERVKQLARALEVEFRRQNPRSTKTSNRQSNQQAKGARRRMALASRQPSKTPYRDRHGHRGIKRPR